jgi:hypothetical protein
LARLQIVVRPEKKLTCSAQGLLSLKNDSLSTFPCSESFDDSWGFVSPKNEWRTWSSCPVIRALQEETPEGFCVFCGRVTRPSKTRQRYVCIRADCQTAYNTEYQRWKRLERVQQGFTQRGLERKSDALRWVNFYKEKP